MKLLKGDFLIVAFVLALSLLIGAYFILPKGEATIAVITMDGKILKEIDLSNTKNTTFNIDYTAHYIIEVKDKKIRIIEATCPDKICVATGFISKAGQVIACLPNRLLIEIKGKQNDVDIIVN